MKARLFLYINLLIITLLVFFFVIRLINIDFEYEQKKEKVTDLIISSMNKLLQDCGSQARLIEISYEPKGFKIPVSMWHGKTSDSNLSVGGVITRTFIEGYTILENSCNHPYIMDAKKMNDGFIYSKENVPDHIMYDSERLGLPYPDKFTILSYHLFISICIYFVSLGVLILLKGVTAER
jgi:hypothetical protein